MAGAGADTVHCTFCFDALVAHLSGGALPVPTFEDALCPLFVTWNKSSSWGRSSLRGCVGTLEPRRIHTALKDYALTSALRDSRFSPISLKEVPALTCSVSLLTDFDKAADYLDWEVGVHGLVLEFTDPLLHCKRSATFLPEVAKDQGWSQQECIQALVRKAGYDGPLTPELCSSLRLTRYKSTKASLSFSDYSQMTDRSKLPLALVKGSKSKPIPAMA